MLTSGVVLFRNKYCIHRTVLFGVEHEPEESKTIMLLLSKMYAIEKRFFLRDGATCHTTLLSTEFPGRVIS